MLKEEERTVEDFRAFKFGDLEVDFVLNFDGISDPTAYVRRAMLCRGFPRLSAKNGFALNFIRAEAELRAVETELGVRMKEMPEDVVDNLVGVYPDVY